MAGVPFLRRLEVLRVRRSVLFVIAIVATLSVVLVGRVSSSTGVMAVGTAADARSVSSGVELQQVLGKGDRLELVLSDQGASATETRGKLRSGVVVSYEDGQIFSLDFANQTFYKQSIADTVADLKRERALIPKMKIEVPVRDGSNDPRLREPTLTPLDLKAEVAGHAVRAYAMHQDGVKTPVRLWLADDLPAPPPAIQDQVAGAIPFPITSGQALLRSETQLGGRWVIGLDTVSIKEVEATPETFAAPKGWQETKPPKLRRPASVPARPLRWFGPISANPDVFALYWNGPFSTSFMTSMNGLLSSVVGGGATASPYWTPLGQYGVGRGRFIGSSPITYPLPATVGSWNFFQIEGMVSTAYFTTSAPKIWWRAFSRDPIIAIMVDTAAVAAGGWGGYHMVNLSVGAFLPWPVSLSAHPEMPWLITKSSPLGAPPNATTTITTSHELVETASDPLPLSANIDYTKSPPWTGGELVDICSVGPPLPFPTTVFRFGFTLGLYWSNAAGACVG